MYLNSNHQQCRCLNQFKPAWVRQAFTGFTAIAVLLTQGDDRMHIAQV